MIYLKKNIKNVNALNTVAKAYREDMKQIKVVF